MRRSIGSGLVKGSRDFNIFFPLHPLGFWRLGGPSASWNISSSWCLVTPLPCYFPSLGIEGAHGSSESLENTAFLSSWEQCLFPGTFHPGYIRGKEPPFPSLISSSPPTHCWAVSSYPWLCQNISLSHPDSPWPFSSSPPEMHGLSASRIHFVQIRSKACSENYWCIG